MEGKTARDRYSLGVSLRKGDFRNIFNWAATEVRMTGLLVEMEWAIMLWERVTWGWGGRLEKKRFVLQSPLFQYGGVSQDAHSNERGTNLDIWPTTQHD